MNNYQIDRRQENGTLDRYDIVKAKNFDEALKWYLGDDYENYSFEPKRVNGKTVITATYPEETSAYLEITKL